MHNLARKMNLLCNQDNYERVIRAKHECPLLTISVAGILWYEYSVQF